MWSYDAAKKLEERESMSSQSFHRASPAPNAWCLNSNVIPLHHGTPLSSSPCRLQMHVSAEYIKPDGRVLSLVHIRFDGCPILAIAKSPMNQAVAQVEGTTVLWDKTNFGARS